MPVRGFPFAPMSFFSDLCNEGKHKNRLELIYLTLSMNGFSSHIPSLLDVRCTFKINLYEFYTMFGLSRTSKQTLPYNSGNTTVKTFIALLPQKTQTPHNTYAVRKRER